MSDQIVNMKIDRVVEAAEALSVAIVQRVTSPTAYAFECVLDARKEYRDALAEFLKPTLRVVEK
jgi:hypothetical protein